MALKQIFFTDSVAMLYWFDNPYAASMTHVPTVHLDKEAPFLPLKTVVQFQIQYSYIAPPCKNDRVPGLL